MTTIKYLLERLRVQNSQATIMESEMEKTAKEIDDLVSEIIMYMNSHNKAGWNSNNSLFTLSIFSILGCSIILLVSFRVRINNMDHNEITSAPKSLFESEH